MAKVLVFYYSAYGHVEKLAHEIAAGAREAGASADVKRVPELLSPEAAKAANYKLDQNDFAEYGAIVVGTGTRVGRMSSQMASFLDQAGGLWAKGALQGKVRRRLRVVGDAARRSGDDAVHHHHQPAPLRHDGGRTELRVRRPNES
jgi:multimeric flavodoxin WrbA